MIPERHDDIPKREGDQLKRILTSATFAKHPVLQSLLGQLVQDNFAGKAGGKGYEIALATKLFNKTTEWAPPSGGTVRERLRKLRKRLDVYYATEGANDTVVISLPRGFVAKFIDRQVVDIAETTADLTSRFEVVFPDVQECMKIVFNLDECIEKKPSHAPSYALLAEVLLACLVCEADVFVSSIFERIDGLLDIGMKLNGELWRLHLVSGARHCCRFAWDKAGASFQRALRLAPDETRAHFWYAAYLLAIGDTEEAKQCIAHRLRWRPHDRLAPYVRSLFFYVLRESESAFDSMPRRRWHGDEEQIVPFSTETVVLDSWPAELLLACLYHSVNNHKDALKYAEEGVQRSNVGAFDGLLVVMGLTYAQQVKTLTHLWSEAGKLKLPRHGLMRAQAAVLSHKLEKQKRPTSLALAYMAQGKTEKAIAQLERACNRGHPLMVWLHLWPIFDPLREHARFKALIRRMNLP